MLNYLICVTIYDFCPREPFTFFALWTLIAEESFIYGLFIWMAPNKCTWPVIAIESVTLEHNYDIIPSGAGMTLQKCPQVWLIIEKQKDFLFCLYTIYIYIYLFHLYSMASENIVINIYYICFTYIYIYLLISFHRTNRQSLNKISYREHCQ